MEVNRVVPGSECLAVVRVHHVRLAFLEARQAGPVATALNAKAAGYPRAETFRSGDLPDEVHLIEFSHRLIFRGCLFDRFGCNRSALVAAART